MAMVVFGNAFLTTSADFKAVPIVGVRAVRATKSGFLLMISSFFNFRIF